MDEAVGEEAMEFWAEMFAVVKYTSLLMGRW